MKDDSKSTSVESLTVDEASMLLRKGIPVSELRRYRNTVLAANESFWEHLKFLDDFRIVEIKDGRLVQTV